MKLPLLFKPHKFASFLTGCLFILLQTGCVVYVPNVINTPLLSEKGEIQANLNFGSSGFDPQISGAVSDHVGLMLNGSFKNSSWNNSIYFNKHNFVEAGAGYFKKFEKYGVMEVYGGAGIGNIKSYYQDIWSDSAVSVKSRRFFIQPAMGVKTDYFEGSFASRFVLLNLDIDSETRTNFFIEPAVTLKGGSKNIKAVFQLGYSFPLGAVTDKLYDPFLLSFGIQGSFGTKNLHAKKPTSF